MKQYTKDGQIKTRNQIVIRKDGMNTYNPTEAMILANGWIEYIVPQPSEDELLQREKEAEVQRLKEELNTSDYKVIKCMEAYLCGEELPYDITEIHEVRNGYRQEINNLVPNE